MLDGTRQSDYFLEHPPRQPKKEVADYVESQGILVPHRFKNLRAAISSGVPFMARSEHPQDYTGASGIATSFYINPEDFTVEASEKPIHLEKYSEILGEYDGHYTQRYETVLKDLLVNMKRIPLRDIESGFHILSRKGTWGSNGIDDYCKYAGLDPEVFMRDTSYSYWEALDGVNNTIFADDVINGRYHIFSSIPAIRDGHMFDQGKSGYHVIEHGEVIGGPKKDITGVIPHFGSMIDFYESVRRLDRFDSNHSPIIEAQLQDGQMYFLQYLRGRDFSPASFNLDREKQADEIKAMFVRGATSPDGLTLRVNVRQIPSHLEEIEEGGLEINEKSSFLEAVLPKRRLQIICENNLNYLYAGGGHSFSSALFKPEVSLVLDYDSAHQLLGDFFDLNRRVIPHTVHVVSDGRKAYLKNVSEK